ncbi:hypothetical protein FDO65_10180 [Nakamurella flava]|uniref:Uncharacterized protein n=1 Tax=Nakamurella flava TaxID=2576308 RepID=A0A4U6QP88_9ACTN|nr:hypothetical protein [Nakamurella flava]TKV61882.1 hypothetical protein FDO65_10180 [Nakamurella flava]
MSENPNTLPASADLKDAVAAPAQWGSVELVHEPTPPPEFTGPQKAMAGAVISTLALISTTVAPFVDGTVSSVLYAVGGALAVIGVPFGIYVTVNKPVR